MLSILNLTFFIAHNALILLNMFGWTSRRTQKLQLAALVVTLFSWCVMGLWRGFGYCLCTDWHFEIRRRLGIHRGETSYSELLLNQLPGITVSREWADFLTGIIMILILILIATAFVWFRRLRTPATA